MAKQQNFWHDMCGSFSGFKSGCHIRMAFVISLVIFIILHESYSRVRVVLRKGSETRI